MKGAGHREFVASALEDPPWGAPLTVASDGTVATAFVGWLANRQELQAERKLPALPSEAALVLRLYLDAGVDALVQLRGSFAVVVWDGDRDALVAAPDPMGAHSLFWARTSSGIVLSDSTRTLLRRCGVSRELNRLALADTLRQRHPDLHETYFAAIRRVAGGHALTADPQGTRVGRIWHPTLEPGANASATALDEFEEHFARAVRRCFDLGPVGIWLSGGLDSVSVSTLARDLAPEADRPPPLALCLGFPDPGVNEQDVQRSVAGQLGLPMVMLGLDEAVAPRTTMEAALDLAETWPVPLMSPWLAAYMALGRAGGERGCRAVLTGSGGDEWLGVSAYLAADLMARGDIGSLAALAASGRRSFHMSLPKTFYYYLWFYGARRLIGRRLLPTYAHAYVEWRDRRQLRLSTPDWLVPDPELRDLADARLVTPPPTRSFYVDEVMQSYDYPMAAMEHEEFFEAGRRIGMPIVAPFLDPDLVDLLHGLSPDVLNQGGRSKGLVRLMLDRRFPDLQFRQQKKVEASTTLERLMADQAPRVLERVGRASALEGLGIVDAGKLEAVTRAAVTTGTLKVRWRYLFQVPMVEVFARRHC